MARINQAIGAYQAASQHRDQRSLDADVFYHVINELRKASPSRNAQYARALADNRRLWLAITGLMLDPTNPLSPALRGSVLSVAHAVQRETNSEQPDLEYLVSINEHFAVGLSSKDNQQRRSR